MNKFNFKRITKKRIKMKNLIITMCALLFIVAANPLYAQKKGNKVVCFKSDMDCAECETSLTEYLKFEKGVKDLKIDHVSNTILVEYKEGKSTDEKLAKAVEKKGYKAEKISTEKYEEILEKAETEGHHHEAEVHKERK